MRIVSVKSHAMLQSHSSATSTEEQIIDEEKEKRILNPTSHSVKEIANLVIRFEITSAEIIAVVALLVLVVHLVKSDLYALFLSAITIDVTIFYCEAHPCFQRKHLNQVQSQRTGKQRYFPLDL